MNKNFIADKEFKSIDYRTESVEKSDYENCRFVQCNFTSLDLSGFQFTDCVFNQCDLSNAKTVQTAFQNTRFESCKLIGLQFDTCNPFLLSFSFRKTILNYASFFHLKIPGTHFSECIIEEADFSDANLNSAIFEHCKLTNSMFENTRLEKADFYSSEHFVIDPDRNNIRGARFALESLPGLLTKYEIVIES